MQYDTLGRTVTSHEHAVRRSRTWETHVSGSPCVLHVLMMMAMMIWQCRTRSQLHESVAPPSRHPIPSSFTHVFCSKKKKKPQSVSRTAAAAAARQETSATPAISTSARPMHVFSHPTQPISARSTIHRRKATKKQSKRYIHIRTPRSTLQLLPATDSAARRK